MSGLARRSGTTCWCGRAFRERVEELMRDRWREPVVVLRLGEASGPGFDVPGRRADGTVEGEHFVRHAFRSVLRGVGFAAAYVLSPSTGGGRDGLSGTRRIHVKGPADALALGLVDAFRKAGARG